jgi:hypothetical protein
MEHTLMQSAAAEDIGLKIFFEVPHVLFNSTPFKCLCHHFFVLKAYIKKKSVNLDHTLSSRDAIKVSRSEHSIPIAIS